MPKDTTAIGSMAEDRAAEYLQQQSLVILARNHRTRFAELDIIACNKDYIVFVEVKYRKHASFGGGVAAITKEKMRRLQNAANVWLAENEDYTKLQPRIDVVTVEGDIDRARIEHLENVSIDM